MDPINIYAQTAPFYDDIARAFSRTDAEIEYYANRVAAAGGEALELACGTGRIALPLAQRGARIWGLDWSAAMLGVFRRKLRSAQPEVAARVRLIRADMAAFALGRRFPIIMLAFGSFNALFEAERRRSCLGLVRDHLEPGGVFILDALCGPRIQSDAIDSEAAQRQIEVEGASNRRMRQSVRHLRADADRQIVWPEMAVHVIEADGREITHCDRFALARLGAGDIRAMLDAAGFCAIEACKPFHVPGEIRGATAVFECRA